jgi:hypothetical protein
LEDRLITLLLKLKESLASEKIRIRNETLEEAASHIKNMPRPGGSLGHLAHAYDEEQDRAIAQCVSAILSLRTLK